MYAARKRRAHVEFFFIEFSHKTFHILAFEFVHTVYESWPICCTLEDRNSSGEQFHGQECLLLMESFLDPLWTMILHRTNSRFHVQFQVGRSHLLTLHSCELFLLYTCFKTSWGKDNIVRPTFTTKKSLK